MTSAFDSLQEEPQTGLARSDFTLEERVHVRVLSVDSAVSRTGSGDSMGSFTSVYYLEGDEYAAARVFADVNAALLDEVDFSGPNPVRGALSQQLYDLVLHHAGERVREIHPTVVREDRQNGVTWIVDRDHYDTGGRRRYSTTAGAAAKVPPGVSLREIFDEAPVSGEIVLGVLEESGVEGDVRQVLDYYRVSSEFSCTPTTVDGELAVVRRASQSTM